MDSTFSMLKKLNWFLEPISNFIMFLFTTSGGITLLILTLVLYLFISCGYNIVKKKHLNQESELPERLRFFEIIHIILKQFWQTFTGIITRIPLLLGIFVLLMAITGISAGIKSMDTFIENQKKIKHLKTVFKQLNKRYKVAEMNILQANPMNDSTTLELQFFDYVGMGFAKEKQIIKIKGNDIYFDAIVLNFEYSEIESGIKKNLTIPYRIFSNKVAKSQGIELNLNDKKGIPYIFHRKENDIYGISPENYNTCLEEIISYIKDDKKARAAGIRSIYGNDVHKRVRTGQKLTIWIEQTGGLVIKKGEQF